MCPYAWDRPGGVQSHVRALAAALRARDHDVTVIAPRASRRAATEHGVILTGGTLPVPANGSVAPISFGPVGAAAVRRALRRIDPDVVHVHEPLIPSTSMQALMSARAPTIGTFHAAADASLGYRVSRPLLASLARRLAIRTAVSEAARALIARYHPGDYVITPNGVDVQRFSTAEPLELPGDKKVLFLGRIERRKGLHVLIEAMSRTPAQGAHLVVAGTGPEERRCRTLARELRVEATFLGRLSEADVARAYRAADVYCAPATGRESFGIVLLEAMAAGALIVCSDLLAFRSVAGDAASFAPPNDAPALARAIQEVLARPAKAEQMRRAGGDIAAAHDWPTLATRLETLYTSLARDENHR